MNIEDELNRVSQLIEQGRLRDAVESCQAIRRQSSEPFLQVAACFEAGVLYWTQIGNGVEARRHFQEAYELTQQVVYANPLAVRPAPGACENMMILSLSYEEYRRWADRLRRLSPREAILAQQRPRIHEMQEAGHPWSQAMEWIASGYYHPDPARDPGQPACAAWIFHLMLEHRKELRLDRRKHWTAAASYAALEDVAALCHVRRVFLSQWDGPRYSAACRAQPIQTEHPASHGYAQGAICTHSIQLDTSFDDQDNGAFAFEASQGPRVQFPG